ncbi:MAG: TonB family protein [Rhodoferax sp.]|nr:TonB family protein [Rhodoferax sp.]
MNRNLVIVASVLLFHGAALWALQTGLLRRAVQVLVPAELLTEFIEPAAPIVEPPPPTPLAATPVKPVPDRAPTPVHQPAPELLAVADPTPVANAPVGVVTPVAATEAVTAPVSVAPPAPSAPPRVELPSSDADYLQNPKPPYPPLSKRLGEQGKVVVRALIGLDGTAQQAQIKQSSGFERLDQSALATVLRWRYVPGKRAGVAEAMWFNVPITFVLE